MPFVPAIAEIIPDQLLSVVGRASSSTCTCTCLRNWKIGFSIILFLEGIVFSHFVLLLRKFLAHKQKAFNTITHFGHALSAGVFFSAGALHILPEAIELLAGESHASHGGEGSCSDVGAETEEDHDDHDHDHDHENEDPAADGGDDDHDEHGHTATFPWAFFVLVFGFYGVFFIEKIFLPKLFPKSLSQPHGHGDFPSVAHGKEDVELSEGTETPTAERDGFASKAFFVAVIQVIGISAHSLFESMALGLSNQFTTVLNVFIATVSHRWLTAIAITFTCAESLSYYPFIAVVSLFSVMVPLGVGIGAALNNVSPELQGVLFAISAATFFYISCFETMSEEFVIHTKMMGRKFIAMVSGATIIAAITGLLVGLDIHG